MSPVSGGKIPNDISYLDLNKAGDILSKLQDTLDDLMEDCDCMSDEITPDYLAYLIMEKYQVGDYASLVGLARALQAVYLVPVKKPKNQFELPFPNPEPEPERLKGMHYFNPESEPE